MALPSEHDASIKPRAHRDQHKEPLRVLFLEPQPCIRALKYAKGLKAFLGNHVSLCFGHSGQSLTTLYGNGHEYFERLTEINAERYSRDIKSLIDNFHPDLIHSHNAPDTYTIAAIDAANGVPVIHDVHEVLSVHHSGFRASDTDETAKIYRHEEKEAVEQSDACIYATTGIRDYMQDHYDVDAAMNLVFPNYISSDVFPQCSKRKLSATDNETHIVYIGCVTSCVEGSHYDLRAIFKTLAAHKLHIHLYPTSNIITKSNDAYRQLGRVNPFIHVHHHMNRRQLLEEMTQYDFGWAGLNGAMNTTHLNIALPNKVIEYIGCGLPVLSFPHKTIQRFLEQYGVGLVCNNIGELKKRLDTQDLSELTENVEIQRDRFTLETQIPRLLTFYENVLDEDRDLSRYN